MQTIKLAASSPAPSTLRRWAIPTGVPATPASAASRPGDPGDRGAVRSMAQAKGPHPRRSRCLGVRPGQPARRAHRANPGTKQVKWLEQNLGALAVTLTPQQLAALDPLAGRLLHHTRRPEPRPRNPRTNQP
jgi:hypothetical protein